MFPPPALAPDAPHYWRAAWDARDLVAQKVGRPLGRADIALAINSVDARTQNQLHIHVDCVRADVRDALSAAQAHIGGRWVPVPGGLDGHPYRAMRVAGESLENVRPFLMLAERMRGARQTMGTRDLAVVGAVFANGQPGFWLLTDMENAATGDRAEGEELIDTTCAP